VRLGRGSVPPSPSAFEVGSGLQEPATLAQLGNRDLGALFSGARVLERMFVNCSLSQLMEQLGLRAPPHRPVSLVWERRNDAWWV
jgi:hypothetical protein